VLLLVRVGPGCKFVGRGPAEAGVASAGVSGGEVKGITPSQIRVSHDFVIITDPNLLDPGATSPNSSLFLEEV